MRSKLKPSTLPRGAIGLVQRHFAEAMDSKMGPQLVSLLPASFGQTCRQTPCLQTVLHRDILQLWLNAKPKATSSRLLDIAMPSKPRTNL